MQQQSALSTATMPRTGSFIERLNSTWHERALWVFMAIVLAHWAEHLAQAYQLYVLKWPVPQSLGVMGLWFPELMRTEILHYGYAIVMLAVLWVLRSGFVGRSYTWWMVAFWIQFWHHIEHALLQGQVIFGANLFNSPVPISIFQLWIRRPELHLIYNAAVFTPMVIAMYYHMFPSPGEEAHMKCSCAIKPRHATADAS